MCGGGRTDEGGRVGWAMFAGDPRPARRPTRWVYSDGHYMRIELKVRYVQMGRFSESRRGRWPLRLGALAVAAVVAAGLSGVAHADPSTVSATADPYFGFDSDVNAVAYLGNTVYAGGIFANAQRNGKLTPRAGLAAQDATTGVLLPWAPVADGPVNALVPDPATNTVYIAGTFTHVNGVARDGIAQLDATTGALTAFTHTISGTPRALALAAGRLYLGGSITKVDGVSVGNVAAFTLATGARDAGFTASVDAQVLAFGYDATNSRLYLGGKFHKINGKSGTNKLGAVNPATGAVLTAFKSKVTVEVRGIDIGPGAVYAALGGAGGRAVAYSLTGAVLWQETTDGDTQAVAYLNGVVYVGGHFDNACTTPLVAAVGGACVDGSISRVKFLAVDATAGTLLGWDPHSSGVHGVLDYAVSPTLGKVAAGGEFSTIGGIYRKKFAQFSS